MHPHAFKSDGQRLFTKYPYAHAKYLPWHEAHTFPHAFIYLIPSLLKIYPPS